MRMRLTRGSLRFRWHAACVAVGAAVVLFFTVSRSTPFVAQWNMSFQDAMLKMTTKQKLPENFLLVGLDDASLSLDTLEPEEIADSKALQAMKKGFPFSREVYGLAAQKMIDAGAKLVIFDMVYPGPNPGDDAFAEVLKKNPGRIVIGSLFERSPGPNLPATYRAPTAKLAEAVGNSVGYASLTDLNEIRHIMPFSTISDFSGLDSLEGETVFRALTTVAAESLGKPFAKEIRRPLRFRYSAPKEVQLVSLYQLFVPQFWKSNLRSGEIFNGKVVLVGATAEGLKDYHATPFGRMSGPEIQLHILAAMLRGSWLHSTKSTFAMVSIFVAALGALVLAAYCRKPAWLILLLLAIGLGWLGICLVALVFGSWFLPAVPPLVTWLVCGFLIMACDASLEARERARLRRELERSMSKDLVKELIDNPASYFHTQGGERKEIVTLFSDLKGFTDESEAMAPEEMVALLNDYFGEMVSVVFTRRGILDKFMGDALMATWGALGENSPRHNARHALQAAFEMRQRLVAINARRQGRSPWQAGIGITQGMVVFGSIGSEEKREFTAIGDSVNLASRMEGLTRIYGCDIIVDERMAENLRGECQLLLVDIVRVKGRQRPEMLFFPYVGDEPGEWAEQFVSARADYREGKFADAEKTFRQLAVNGLAPTVADLYARRCAEFVKEPPEGEWTGVWDFVSK
jgi:adenylate cyclase